MADFTTDHYHAANRAIIGTLIAAITYYPRVRRQNHYRRYFERAGTRKKASEMPLLRRQNAGFDHRFGAILPILFIVL